MESLTREGEREFFRLKDKYADYIFDGKKYYKIINGKRQEVPAPENLEEYNYYRYKVMPDPESVVHTVDCNSLMSLKNILRSLIRT